MQNVFYRDWLIERAGSLGIDGWVRNRTDGSVEAVVQGPARWSTGSSIWRAKGPLAARVDDVVVHDDVPNEVLAGFEKRPTA